MTATSRGKLRSQLREDERFVEIMSHFRPEEIPTLPRAPGPQEFDASQWKGGVEPMPFDEFCERIDGAPMFPRQADAWDRANVLRAQNILCPTRTITEYIYIWGKGCLAGDTLLRDERTETTRTLAEWERDGRALLLRSWSEEKGLHLAASLPVYRKGCETLYCVTLEGGQEFRGTAAHRCLMPEGWKSVGQLRPGLDALLALDRCGTQDAHGTAPSFSRVSSIEAIGEGDFYDLTVPGSDCYFDADGVLHHNSGKDFLGAKWVAYLAYILHALKEDPCTYMSRTGGFHLAPGTRLDIVNVAPNEDLALQVFFDYLKRNLSSPLFKHIDMYPRPEAWRPGTNELIFPSINLHLYSKTSKSSGLDGFNLLAFIMDEADDFFSSAERSNAEDIHKIFRRTMLGRFHQFGLGIVISYPRYEEGFLLNLEKRAIADNEFEAEQGRGPLYFVDKASTEEVRPDFDRNSPEIAAEYRNDPLGARAMYDCIPTSIGSPWIEFPEKIKDAVDETLVPVAFVTQNTVKRYSVAKKKDVEYISVVLDSCNPVPGHQYFLAVDGGISGDAYAVCVMHTDETPKAADWLCPFCGATPAIRRFAVYEELKVNEFNDIRPKCGICYQTPGQRTPTTGKKGWWHKLSGTADTVLTVNGRAFPLPRIYEDFLIDVKPRRGMRSGEADILVDLPAMEELILGLMTALRPVKTRLDPWQTAQMTQGLANKTGMDISEILFSNALQFKRARLFKAMLYANMLSLLPNERAERETRRLQRKSETRIDHPDGAGESKDMYDVRAINIWEGAVYGNAEIAIHF